MRSYADVFISIIFHFNKGVIFFVKLTRFKAQFDAFTAYLYCPISKTKNSDAMWTTYATTINAVASGDRASTVCAILIVKHAKLNKWNFSSVRQVVTTV